jgi:hypothetical protein
MRKSTKLPVSVKKDTTKLFTEISSLIESAKNNASISVNRELLFLYWHIGKIIINKVLKGKRATYGNQIVATLSQHLSWSHFIEILLYGVKSRPS